MEHMISPVIFAGALTIFAGALPPWAPAWCRGRDVQNLVEIDSSVMKLLMREKNEFSC